jgi:hypothetical protein
VIGLLGYVKNAEVLDISNWQGSYFWYDRSDYKSWVGVELDIYKKGTQITINTSSRAGRSNWDLVQQKRTLKILRDLFGGHFTTDAGKNRYWRPEQPSPLPVSSGCYMARWAFQNGLVKAKIYLMHRILEGSLSKDEPSGFIVLDEVNPRLLSNNFLVPYLIAIWEDYFRSTFAALLKYSKSREVVLKKARLSHTQLEKIAIGKQPFERAVAECFSFQRPSLITENFRMLDQKLDLAGALRKPYRRRKTTLFDSMEALVERRNAFVHEGDVDLSLFDREMKLILSDIVTAVDRSYKCIGNHYKFAIINDY